MASFHPYSHAHALQMLLYTIVSLVEALALLALASLSLSCRPPDLAH